jgi:pimeloyl-ACP methyl ester carboxylesterase
MKLKIARRHLVLLPGLDGSGSLFGPLLAALPEELTPVVVSYPRDKVLYYEQLMPYIREVMPWGEPYVLLAESFSGPLAIKFAAEQPENIDAIVLCSAFFSKISAPSGSWTTFFTNQKWFENATPDSAIKQLVAGGVCEPAMLAGIKSAIKAVPPEVLSHRVKLMFETNLTTALPEVRSPILCLAGTQDKLGAAQAMQEVLKVKPDSGYVTFETSHLILQTKPREAIEAILNFLHKLPSNNPIPISPAAPNPAIPTEYNPAIPTDF